MKQPRFYGLTTLELIKRTYAEVNDDDVLAYGAALAYNEMLAIFPFLIFLLSLLTFLHVPGLFDTLTGWVRTVVPSQAAGRVLQVVGQFENTHNGGLLSLGIAGSIWAASGAVRAATTALNRAYDVHETRRFWKRYPLSIAYTIALGLLLLLALGVFVVGPDAAAWLGAQLHVTTIAADVWRWVRYPMALAVAVLLAALTYSLLPDVEGFRLFTPGSVIAVLMWVGLSEAFRAYFRNFGSYNAIYGTVGAFIVLLLYLWLSSIALLVGGEVDAVLGVARRARKREKES